METTLRRIGPLQNDSLGKAVFETLETIHALREELSEFSRIISFLRGKPSGGETTILPAEHPSFREGKLNLHLLGMRKIMKKITTFLSFLKDDDSCRQLGIHSRSTERLKTALQDIEDYADNIKAIADTCNSPQYVTAAVIYVHHWAVSSRAVEVAEILRANLYNIWDSVIFTSATLRRQESFADFMSIAGMTPKTEPPVAVTTDISIDKTAAGPPRQKKVASPKDGPDGRKERDFRFEAIPSPFTSDAFVITVPAEAISGGYESKELWLSCVAGIVPGLVRENRGRTLILFASYRDLNEIAARIGDDIRAAGYPLLLQESGASTISLVEEFREIRESVLFGVDSFWFGVDFPGDTLTQVIITRLPFPHPQDPLQIARRNILPKKEYWRRYRYETAIKLRQGIGRLIRSEADSGRVVILDARYRKYYGEK
jgi:ATP-dependent DNA helicase DinG